MLLPISRPTDKFAPLAGLRSLLFPDAVAVGGRGVVVTRTILASSLPCGARGEGEAVGQESGDGESVDDEEEDEGCWVPYGRRGEPGRRRRLPPPIPSLAARSALRRARTDDRRLVISKVRVMRPDYYVRARRVRGGRLVMRLHEREDDDPLPPSTARDIAQVDTATTSDEKADDAQAAAAAPDPLPSAGCFEDVVRYQYAVGSSPLHQTPLLRMVH